MKKAFATLRHSIGYLVFDAVLLLIAPYFAQFAGKAAPEEPDAAILTTLMNLMLGVNTLFALLFGYLFAHNRGSNFFFNLIFPLIFLASMPIYYPDPVVTACALIYLIAGAVGQLIGVFVTKLDQRRAQAHAKALAEYEKEQAELAKLEAAAELEDEEKTGNRDTPTAAAGDAPVAAPEPQTYSPSPDWDDPNEPKPRV